MDTPPPSPAALQRKAALSFIFVTVTIDILAFGVIIPVLPHLIQAFVGGSIAAASRWSGIFSSVFALTQFIFSPIQGALSDRFGRRPVILLSCLGLGIDFLVMGFAHSLAILFIGRLVSGMTAASFSTANAYIADVTPPEGRGGAFGMLGAAFGIGFVVGPALGSLLSGFDLRAPFWGAAALALCNFLYGLWVLPESLTPAQRSSRFDWRSATAFGSFRNLRRYPQVTGLAIVSFLMNTAHYVLPSTIVLYTDYRYHWGARSVGLLLAAVGVSNAIVQANLAGKIIRRVGEMRALLIGAGCGAIGFSVYGCASTGIGFLLGIPLQAFWGLCGPATQSLLSRQVAANEQGRLQGAVASLTSLAGIFAPFMFANLFASAIEKNSRLPVPGIALLSAAMLVLFAGLYAARMTKTIAAPSI